MMLLVLNLHFQEDVVVKHRSNVPADTPSQHYNRSISIPVLDHLLSEMMSRFTSNHQTALLGLSIVPSVIVTMSVEELTANANKLTDFYKDNLPF